MLLVPSEISLQMKKYLFYGSGIVLLWTLTRYIRSRRNANQGAIVAVPVPENDFIDPPDDGNVNQGAIALDNNLIDPPDDGNANQGAIAPAPDNNFIDPPDDALIEVFKIFPIPSIMQLQCVSKDWRRVIRSPNMVQTHLERSQENPFLLLQNGNAKYNVLRLFVLNGGQEFHEIGSPLVDPLMKACVIGSSNGLICLAIGQDRSHVSSFVVWNPEIRKTRPVLLRTEVDCFLGFGFGNNDYKIVMLYWSEGGFVHKVEVFSLYTMPPLWKEVEFGGSLDNVRFQSDGVTITGAGAVVWWVYLKTNEGFKSHLAIFDIAKEEFSLIPFPTLDAATRLDFRPTEYEKKLALLSQVYIENVRVDIELWVIDERMQVWTKKGSTGPLIGLWEPVTVLRNEIVCSNDQVFEEANDIEHAGDENAENENAEDENAEDENPLMFLHMHNVNTDTSRIIGTHRFEDADYIFNHIKSLVPVENGAH